jgi:uncharacterized protein
MNTMKLYPSGLTVNPFRLALHQVQLGDIAHSLSRLCRFNGHYASFYSVAEHAMRCSYTALQRYGDPALARACLHHDDAEAYFGDIIAPIKHRAEFQPLRNLETAIDEQIETKFQVDLSDPRVKEIDLVVLQLELNERFVPKLFVPGMDEVAAAFVSLHYFFADERYFSV